MDILNIICVESELASIFAKQIPRDSGIFKG
jgi:hypothetical protein